MQRNTKRPTYQVGGRNDYYGIDEYRGDSCMRNIDAFKSRKQANLTAGHLASAYADGWRDGTGAWPNGENTDPPDVPAAYLGCPVHYSNEVSDRKPDAAAASAEANHCRACALVAEFIRTRDTLRRLAIELHKINQDAEDLKHGTGRSFKSGFPRAERL